MPPYCFASVTYPDPYQGYDKANNVMKGLSAIIIIMDTAVDCIKFLENLLDFNVLNDKLEFVSQTHTWLHMSLNW